MTTDPTTMLAPSAGQSASRLTDAQAQELSLDDSDQQLQAFIGALAMARPVSTELAARLIDDVVRGTTSANVDLLEAQMRIDGWENVLSPGEQLSTLAMRANAYLESAEGIEMFNLFTRNVARTTGEIFD